MLLIYAYSYPYIPTVNSSPVLLVLDDDSCHLYFSNPAKRYFAGVNDISLMLALRWADSTSDTFLPFPRGPQLKANSKMSAQSIPRISYYTTYTLEKSCDPLGHFHCLTPSVMRHFVGHETRARSSKNVTGVLTLLRLRMWALTCTVPVA